MGNVSRKPGKLIIFHNINTKIYISKFTSKDCKVNIYLKSSSIIFHPISYDSLRKLNNRNVILSPKKNENLVLLFMEKSDIVDFYVCTEIDLTFDVYVIIN